jgi:hypothetical protein
MSLDRNKEQDKVETCKLILAVLPVPASTGGNWLGHGRRDGKNAVIDFRLLAGAAMEDLLTLRNSEAAIRAHFSHLKDEHDLPVKKYSDGKYRFDRKHLQIVGAEKG